MTNTVLYVEDDDDNIRLVKRLLNKRRPDVVVIVATSGQDGIRLAQSSMPNLVLLDRRLPDMLGNEVLRQLKDASGTATIPVVMLSGDSAADQVAEALRLGAADFVVKPFEFHQLLTVIDRFSDQPPVDP
jgi:DNA-binding response OmpR family regulator